MRSLGIGLLFLLALDGHARAQAIGANELLNAGASGTSSAASTFAPFGGVGVPNAALTPPPWPGSATGVSTSITGTGGEQAPATPLATVAAPAPAASTTQGANTTTAAPVPVTLPVVGLVPTATITPPSNTLVPLATSTGVSIIAGTNGSTSIGGGL